MDAKGKPRPRPPRTIARTSSLLASLALALILSSSLFTFFPDRAIESSASDKVDPDLLAEAQSGGEVDILILLANQPDTRAVTRQVEPDRRPFAVSQSLQAEAESGQRGVTQALEEARAIYRVYWIVNAVATRADLGLIEKLAGRGDVQRIESNRPFKALPDEPPNQELAPEAAEIVPWGVGWIGAPEVWARGATGQGIVYANADTGVLWTHPALQPNYRGWNGASADHNYNWHDAIHADLSRDGDTATCGLNSPEPCDDNGHGTHTTGTGIGDDYVGNQIGVAPGARWIACRNMEEGVGQPSTYIECLQFFVAPTDLNGQNPNPSLHADVIGNSYSCPPSEGCAADSLRIAVENVRAAGIFVSVSAGNSGSGCATVNAPPGIYDASFTVGAIDSNGAVAGYSSRGPVTVDGSGRRKPDLVAPGSGVRSSLFSGGYGDKTGTSMAAPHVAGAVAVLWSAFPALRGDIPATELLLTQSALPIGSAQVCGGETSGSVPNNIAGSGALRLDRAYNLALNGPPLRHLLPLIFNVVQ